MIGHSHQQYSVLGVNILDQSWEFGARSKIYKPRMLWGLYHESDAFELKNFTYDIGIVISEMKARKYPQICLEYYQNKEQSF